MEIQIPGYLIKRELYRTERTLIYQATRTSDNSDVIIKTLNGEYPSSYRLSGLRHEFSITKKIAGKGAIEAYELIKFGNNLALILQDFHGISLHDHLKENGWIDLKMFLTLAIEICNCLEGIHQLNVIHKDINPSNILFNQNSNKVQIIDFGISTELSREKQSANVANKLEGSLPYISPEQTGRMNRSIDYRTDFYSLGVTYYQLLTNRLPFHSIDAIGMLHSHIAKSPPAPHEAIPAGDKPGGGQFQIPKVVSQIILKLMSKAAEDRYQSVYGLRVDLQQCLDQLSTNGIIEDFAIGQHDFSDKFQIPQKLYGRENEIEALIATFDRVSNGSTELMLVAGYSGIGKSVLVNEIHKPIVEKRGHFISGKFDQFQRNIPYASLIQAFKEMAKQILSESDEQIEKWKKRLTDALGKNGQVIVNVIPEVELIIGEQEPLQELGPNEALNRFNSVFQLFVQAFASQERPLVIFLDDLQWADNPSLQLMDQLMTNPDMEYIFMIGSYRDNEVDGAHPLMLTLGDIQKKGQKVETITLPPLDLENVNQIISETLHCDPNRSGSLSDLCMEKTNGNPFFLNQFLTTLYNERYLNFDTQKKEWNWDSEKIGKAETTANVVDLMATKLKQMKKETLDALRMASCIGGEFDLKMLSIVHEKSPSQTALDLWEALEEGLIIPRNDLYKFITDTDDFSEILYKFLHDRVQQAAYSLIEEDHKKEINHKIGRLLLEHSSEEEQEKEIFDIVNHLNFGIELSSTTKAKDELSKLNLQAGAKARASAAFDAALKYFTTGLNLLSDDCWSKNYELTLQLYFGRAEMEFVTGSLENAKKFFSEALNNAKNDFDKAETYARMMDLSMTSGEFSEGIEAGLAALGLMGVDIPSDGEELEAAIEKEFSQIKSNLGETEVAELFNLPEMTDRHKQISLDLLANLWTLAYISAQQGYLLITPLKSVNISLIFGNSENSAFGYTLYGMISRLQENYTLAFELGRLGIKLNEKYNNVNLIARTNNIFGHSMNPYKRHLKTNVAIYRKGYEGASLSGDMIYKCWALHFIILTKFTLGEPLEQLLEEGEPFINTIKESHDSNILRLYLGLRQVIHYLLGRATNPDGLAWDGFNEAESYEHWRKGKFDAGTNWFSYLKMQLLYLDGDYSKAMELGKKSEELVASNFGFWPMVKYYFYYSLSLIQVYRSETDENKRKDMLEKVDAYHDQLKVWSEHCPENFLHKALLVEAERARIMGEREKAFDLYDRAIESAHENEYLQNEALANELAAQFYLQNGKEKAAKGYLTEARYLYAQWGAARKVEELEKNYSHLKLGTSEHKTVLSISSTSTGSSSFEPLDLESVTKASKAISGEIVLENLLKKLMTLLIENAGAQSGVIILQSQEEWKIEAQGFADNDEVTVLHSIPIDTDENDVPPIPLTMINYVVKMKEPIVLDDAINNERFAKDIYVMANQSKSVLCTPILRQDNVTGILYLENNLTAGVFTADKVEVISLLASQAAISLENAMIYKHLEDLVEERTKQLSKTADELKKANNELERLSYTDPLTKIANKRMFIEKFENEWHRGIRSQKPLSICLIDIDFFKLYNDTYGHLDGDHCLHNVAQTLKTGLTRTTDFVARFGGEEFIILLPETSKDSAVIVGQRLVDSIRALQISHSTSLVDCKNVTISLGISEIIPQQNMESSILIKQADTALYRAKNLGRDRVSK